MKSFKSITQATLFSFLGFALLTSAYAMEESELNPIHPMSSFKTLDPSTGSVFLLDLRGTVFEGSRQITAKKATREIHKKNQDFLEAVKLQSEADHAILAKAKKTGTFPTEEDLAQTLESLTDRGIYFLPFTKTMAPKAEKFNERFATLKLQFLQKNAEKLGLQEGFTNQFKIVHGIMFGAQTHVSFADAAKDIVSKLSSVPPVFGVIDDHHRDLIQMTNLSLDCPIALYQYTAAAYFDTAEKVEHLYNEGATKEVFSKYQADFDRIFK